MEMINRNKWNTNILVLVLNFNTATAASTNTTTPILKTVNPANHSIIQKSQTIKITFNEPIKFGNK